MTTGRGQFTLAEYEKLLSAGLASGYAFLSFDKIGSELTPLSCLLRHDIDVELFGCEPMLDIEAGLGVKATYFLMTRSTAYNLFCLEGRKVVERLLRSGQDIGLHFMGELCPDDEAAALAEKVLIEVEWLKCEFGARICAVSFHQPTQAILDGEFVIGDLVNTYNKRQMRDYSYVSDTNMHWRELHPADIFAQHLRPRLHLLIHPIWWTAESLPVERKWLEVLRRSNATVINHWQQRERTLRACRLADQLSSELWENGEKNHG